MTKIRGDPNQLCDRCSAQLQRASCGACSGRGHYRVGLVFKKECAVCLGSGQVWRCPNEFQHILEDFNLSKRLRPRSLYKNFRRIPLETPASAPKSAGISIKPPRVPPPWHFSYPFPWHPAHPRNPRNQPFNNPMGRR